MPMLGVRAKALQALDEGEHMRRWQEKAETMCTQLQGIVGVEAEGGDLAQSAASGGWRGEDCGASGS